MNNHLITVYSDESRHLRGQSSFMVIGAIWCTMNAHRSLTDKVTLLKRQYEISKRREVKWTKISPAKTDYYNDLVKLFFEEKGLNFRAIVVPTHNLRHEEFEQTEDEFYYKMQYTMLNNIARKHRGEFKIYLDYKDTWSNIRTKKLVAFLSSHHHDEHHTFQAQPIRSYESTPMQLADLLIGAISYANNLNTGNKQSEAKTSIISTIEGYAGQKLTEPTPFGVDKFNIFIWDSK